MRIFRSLIKESASALPKRATTTLKRGHALTYAGLFLLLDVKFLDPVEGWAVGNEGTVLHTIDGGRHWLNERSPTLHPLERIFFTDRDHGWAVGFGGTIISYSANRLQAPTLRR